MIYKNNKTINEWYFNDAELIKVYKNGAICYYKMVLGGTPSQEPCFAVVNDITQYSDTEFIDVYDKATDKWYKLNNLDQYEQYGVYGEGRNITYYEGKLTIDNGYEYEWDGSEWDNLGEITGGTAPLPVGYTEVEYVGSNGNAYINTGLQLMDAVGNTFSIEGRVWTEYYVTNDGFGYLMSTESTTSPFPGFCWRWNQHHSSVLEFGEPNAANATLSTVDKGDGTSGFTVSSNGTSLTNNNIPFTLFAGLTGTSSSNSAWRFSKSKYYDELKITKNNQVVADYIPCQRDSDSKYGFYDLVSESFITSSNNILLLGGDTASEYPKYYTEKDEPENNVVFTDMEEALAYECPWVGMDVTIDNAPYLFGDAYEWLTKYGLFEVSGEYICDSGDKYEKMEEMVRNVDGTWSSQIPAVYEKGDLIEAGSPDCSHSLPDVPFILNYNAKDYDATNRRLPKTYGQLRNSDAVCNYGYHIVDHSADGYITVTGDTRMIISGTPYMNRTNTQTGCTMTIVSKVKTTNATQSYSILTNRGSWSTMNWMWRYPSNGIFLHGSTSYNNPLYLTSTTGQPITASIRISYNGGVKQQLNDWTNNGSYSGNFQYGPDYNGNNAMFCDYATENAEFWKGDFYWVYMSFNVLTDEEIQQVIDYNENL